MYSLLAAALALADFAVPVDAVPPRDVSTVEKALVGHWRTDDDKTDYYFSAAHGLVMVDNGRRQDQKWRVVGSKQPERKLDVEVTVVDTGKGHVKNMQFTTDYRAIDESITIAGITINGHWKYVDGKQHP